MFIVMLFSQWQFEAMTKGMHPALRHVNSAFDAEGFDAVLASLTDTCIAWVAALIYAKCDMQENVTTFVTPSVALALHS